MKVSNDLLRFALLGLGVVVITTGPDSSATSRAPAPGYGGVLVVPVMEDDGGTVSLDDLLALRRLRRVEGHVSRGRVLPAGSRTAVPADSARAPDRSASAPAMRSSARSAGRPAAALVQGRSAPSPST
jgi:hypothetical protein